MPTIKQNANALSLLLACLVFSSFAFLNIDGYQLHVLSPWGGGDTTGEPPVINWVHGWPVGCVVRSSIYSVNAGRAVKVQSFTGEHGLYSRWPIDESPVTAFSSFAATCDLLISLTLLIGTFVGTRKLVEYVGLHFQFRIRSLMVCVFAFAVLLAIRDWVFASRFVLEVLAILATAFGACMCLVALPWPKRKPIAAADDNSRQATY